MAPQIIWKFVCKITRLCSLEFCCSFIGNGSTVSEKCYLTKVSINPELNKISENKEKICNSRISVLRNTKGNKIF